MTSNDTNASDAFVEPKPTASTLAPTRPFYWSVRRELWENRIYIAPLVVAGVLLFGFLLGAAHPSRHVRMPSLYGPWAIVPYAFVAAVLVITSLIVSTIYSLGALYSERRDRSVLFWKSLPVSDSTTVLAKLSIPMVIVPLVTFAIIVILQGIMWIVGGAGLMVGGTDGSSSLAQVPLLRMQGLLLYGLFALTLWNAPLYGWLFLISGWAKRAPFLWAVLPPIAVSLVEEMAFHTSHFAELMHDRFNGAIPAAFAGPAHFIGHPDSPAQIEQAIGIDPVGFVTTPGLWLGLLVAAGFIAAAVRLRRYREPI